MRRLAKGAHVLLAVLAVSGSLAPSALAHEERPVEVPDGSGEVPEYRADGPRLLVCNTDREDFAERIAEFPAELKQQNLEWFDQCQDDGFRTLQEAVDQATGEQPNIAILPGVYLEEPSLAEPSPECADLTAKTADLGHQVLSYEQQEQCRHNQNLVAVIGREDLQIEGTGAEPQDVVIDAQYRKLNGLRADLADGIYLRNFTVQRTTFNAVYVLGTDGFVIDRMLGRWNDEYGFLTFASDHGLYTECEAYGNGDSGLYPGSAADVNKDRGYNVPRYAVEIRQCHSHHNMNGLSGTAGNSVWAHDNEFSGNQIGVSFDSAFPNHPGLPQNHSLLERNNIHDNNQDYYQHVRDGTCAKPSAERGYEQGVVCPAIGTPPGVGVIIAGGNDNVFRDNWISGHNRAAFMLVAVPAFIRGEHALGKQADNAHRNVFLANHLGELPDGRANPNATDLWWDGQGTRNCWQSDRGPTDPPVVPDCGDRPGLLSGTTTHRVLGDPVKLTTLLVCNSYDLRQRQLPAGCSWYGATGFGRLEVQIAVVVSALLAVLGGFLLWWQLRGERTARVASLIGLAGVVLNVLAATKGETLLPALALTLIGLWWLGIGVVLRRSRRMYGWLTVALGILALLDAVDRSVWMLPLLPLSPTWFRGLLAVVWVVWTLVVLMPRRQRDEAAEPAGPAGPDLSQPRPAVP